MLGQYLDLSFGWRSRAQAQKLRSANGAIADGFWLWSASMRYSRFHCG